MFTKCYNIQIFSIMNEILPDEAPRYMNTSIESKNSILHSVLSEVFGDKMKAG
jgi:hypothetical protein